MGVQALLSLACFRLRPRGVIRESESMSTGVLAEARQLEVKMGELGGAMSEIENGHARSARELKN